MTDEQIKPLCAGDRIKDNDERMGKRVLFVQRLDERYAYAVDAGGFPARILKARIFIDSKSRKSGFSRIPE